jgi:hypothetical protein
MGFAAHLGPWRLGTVKDTTGTTAGTISNMGCATVAQTKAVVYNDTAASQAFVLPAGALLMELYLNQAVATFTSGSSGTFTVLLNGTAIGALTITTGTAGILSITPSSQAQAALWANVGATDAIITYTGATLSAGSGILIAKYAVRGSDGAQAPSPSQN